MAKMPTTASRPAAVVSGMPWPWAEGMKWVATSPLVDAPQIANSTARAQKVRVRAASAGWPAPAGPVSPSRVRAPRPSWMQAPEPGG
jgi:hypothetical protein